VSDSPLGRWLRQLKPSGNAATRSPPPTPARSAGAARRELPSPDTAGNGRQLQLRAGDTLGGYHVIREVGRGAMATVYQARHAGDGQIVALKVLSMAPDGIDDRLDDARLRLLREAEAAGRIQHPDIVQVVTAGEERGIVFLAMEFVEGVSLATHAIEGRLLPPRLVAQMCGKVADCLGFAHARGVVHRDVKPANIVYDPRSKRVRVMDFGVARLTDSSATRTGIILGSPSYMAPEQLDGRGLSGSADLFSLGVTLFQLLTAQLPFRADSIPRLMQRIATEPHPPLASIRPDLPARLGLVIDRALEKDAARRYATGAEMATALNDAARDIPASLR
jgi:serine/threonine-protein kinase